ncbi:MAG: SHOCT domain-containing protein, partial [Actinobacteria bacterium ATB1]|nr:SHOCT domain-containing protein [Actinobacteria bacterium ATB1]
ADRDAQIYAQREQAYQQQVASQAPADEAAAPAAVAATSMTDELTKLADMKAQGLLTEEEFAAAKARLLGG